MSNTQVGPHKLSKKERQQLALERRKQQVMEQKRRDELNSTPLTFTPEPSSLENERSKVIAEPSRSTSPSSSSLSAITSREVLSLDELISMKKQQGTLDTPKFLTKRQREELEMARVQDQERIRANDAKQRNREETINLKRPLARHQMDEQTRYKRTKEDINKIKLTKERNGRGRNFQFEWDDKDDTTNSGLISEYHFTTTTDQQKDPLSTDNQMNDLHWSIKPLSAMKTRDWRIMKEDFEIITRGQNLAQPLRSWDESDIDNSLLDIIYQLGYKQPTPIQRASIPISLNKRDIIGVAETGSGKTLAFLIPMLSKILKMPRLNDVTKSEGPYGLILVPTRELAQQIELELNRFLKYLPLIDTISIVGGKLIERNILDLQNKNIEIVIATPGRLIDCLERHYLVLNQVQFLVLDESDKMIEMNFGEQVEKITDFISSAGRQNMMFTATLTNEVESLSRKYVNEPAIVNIGSASSKEVVVNERITQRFEFFSSGDDTKRMKRIERIVTSHQFKPPIIVFINYKETGEQLFRYLQNKNVKVTLIHGSKNQDQREAALKQLKDGRADVLIATSVASRGIDIPDVSLVVNYHMTRKIDEYIHRIGRTGRAGKYGTSITFLGDEVDAPMYGDLKRVVLKSGGKLPDEFKKLGEGLQAIV